jgi:hypothetical protein
MTVHITRVSEDANGWFARCRACPDFTPRHQTTATRAIYDAAEHKRNNADTCSAEGCERNVKMAITMRQPGKSIVRRQVSDRLYMMVDFDSSCAPATALRYCGECGRELVDDLMRTLIVVPEDNG